jgi:hypothetical protein
MRPTPTLVRLHIQQGYLGSARVLLDAMAKLRGGVPDDLEASWAQAARQARRQARVDTLKRLLSRVRRVRSRNESGRGAIWAR